MLDRLVKHMQQMRFGWGLWVLLMAKELHLAKSFGGYDGRSSSLRAKAVGILSISIFVALMVEHRNLPTSRSNMYLTS